MLNFPKNLFVPTNQKEKEIADAVDQKNRERFSKRFLLSTENIKVPVIKEITKETPISQKVSIYSEMAFGQIGTVSGAACGPLAIEYALRSIGMEVSFEEILKETVEKGYRSYIFNDEKTIMDGDGTDTALFDNVATKVKTFSEMIHFLKKGCPITILIENAIYHEDTARKGNHFITLIGIDEEKNAIFMDGNLLVDETSKARICKPFFKMGEGFKGAWAWDREEISKILV